MRSNAGMHRGREEVTGDSDKEKGGINLQSNRRVGVQRANRNCVFSFVLWNGEGGVLVLEHPPFLCCEGNGPSKVNVLPSTTHLLRRDPGLS